MATTCSIQSLKLIKSMIMNGVAVPLVSPHENNPINFEFIVSTAPGTEITVYYRLTHSQSQSTQLLSATRCTTMAERDGAGRQ